MIQSKKVLIIALAFPLIVLLALTAYKGHILSSGEDITLPIFGHDPRDFLSGHYLTYQIDYGVERICPSNPSQKPGYICLKPKGFSYTPPADCSKLIRGICHYSRFEAGIEKFYVPEHKAKEIEQQILLNAASIVLSVTPNGQAQVKDLLINGKSWKNK